MKSLFTALLVLFTVSTVYAQAVAPESSPEAVNNKAPVFEQTAAAQTQPAPESEKLPGNAYPVGVGDVLEITVQEPEAISRVVKVAPDGTITFVYIGSIYVKGLDIPQIQKKIQDALSKGFLKYPVVLVALQQSNSKQYMVYGEINRPGAYPLEGTTTALRAISIAGGFTRFGSSSRVKILRPRTDGAGYDTLKIDINKVMAGDSTEDMQIKEDDMIVVSEGVF
ncbi:MAG: polysaccharide biosynthesis/export family protein [Candidatus Omnitrophota bacterium]